MLNDSPNDAAMPRRKFLKISAATAGVWARFYGGVVETASAQKVPDTAARGGRPFGGEYVGEYLNQIAFPMGGLGAGDDLPGRHGRAFACFLAEPA